MRFLGDSLPERLRSTTLGLIGVVAAACLALVGLTLQDRLPLASSGPIHGPVESEVGPARALTEPRPERRDANPRGSATSVPVQPVRASRPDDDPTPVATSPATEPVARPPVDSNPGDGNSQRQRPPSAPPVRSNPAPASTPEPPPVEELVAMPSRELPEPAPEEPAEEPAAVPGNGHAYGKGSGGGPDGTGPPGLAKK
ncbi:MAG TPA: hypothetical protein VFY04_10405 [Solirubrobacterales bacterium]|nr:hypothetical protein [Solirubrobacterales bacterium]